MAGKKKRKVFSWKRVLVSLFLLLLTVWVVGLIYLRQPTLKSSEPSEIEVDQVRLEAHVRRLSEDFLPRDSFSIGNMKRTADYIRVSLDEAAGQEGRTQDLWFETLRKKFRNVSLLLGPDNGEDRLVIGAHYDAYENPVTPEFDPGADDNASGVAGVIELARLLAPIENRLTRPVELVCYPLEEPPTFGTTKMGSAFHARDLKGQDIGVHLMISVEMIGYFSDERGSQKYPVPGLQLFYPTRGSFIGVIGNDRQREFIQKVKVSMKGSTPLPVYSICAHDQLPGIDFSDHRNYWREGYPALMITDTAMYRNLAYHTPEDTADRLDFERMAMVVAGLYEAVLDLAASDR